jgi:hypothetical protein
MLRVEAYLYLRLLLARVVLARGQRLRASP